jgi:hypothetical protein
MYLAPSTIDKCKFGNGVFGTLLDVSTSSQIQVSTLGLITEFSTRKSGYHADEVFHCGLRGLGISPFPCPRVGHM